jgi:hypothetical protein
VYGAGPVFEMADDQIQADPQVELSHRNAS